MRLASGHVAVQLEGEELAKIQRDFGGFSKGLVRLTPGRWVLPAPYTKFADKIYNMKFRASDVLIMTYPKCGTTWTQEVVWTMRNNPNLDHPKASIPVKARSPFVDSDMLTHMGKDVHNNELLEMVKDIVPHPDPDEGLALQMTANLPDPRTIKTHLPFSLMTPDLLDTAKVIYVARNPKDVVLSFLHHSRLMKSMSYVGSLEQYVDYFVNDQLIYGPYWEHLREAWPRRDHPNMHFLFYEDMKADPKAELRKLNQFLGTDLTEEQLQKIAHYTSFEEMKKRDEVFYQTRGTKRVNTEVSKKDGGFYRKGEAGSWRGQLTDVQETKIDDWTKVNSLKLDISFRYSV
ncbi:estrogen sulfotransferase [Penaeus vannamei]|uniref:Estrogen sulfotransferase n=1 Tax=Penaeus vannamei TaxID=6689 RepID=A0A423TWG7_PENVA|nr:sulfotransferase 1C4-like [Penaeus vannamei]XP_027211493.1 sulfotransferase 1C4-like [Penaeus vannamei]ROT80799.1 estrogen sulfotransferase [Penaeus vannamei]